VEKPLGYRTETGRRGWKIQQGIGQESPQDTGSYGDTGGFISCGYLEIAKV
jgi:hypothetical protein